jgi:ABC-type phosphate transport system auxiliary subunit
MQRAADAEAEASARVKKAVNDADTSVEQTHDALTVQIAAAQAEATDTIQGIAKHVQDAQAQHDSEMLHLEVSRLAAQAEFDALQTKLDALKVNAQKFAAALVG